MFDVGDLVECTKDCDPQYYKGYVYEVRSFSPTGYNTGTVYTVMDSDGSSTNGWGAENFILFSKGGSRTFPTTPFYLRPKNLVYQPAPIHPQPQQSLSSSGVQTLPGGYQIYWESSGTEQSPAPTVKDRYCTPKEYVGFTKIDYYCTKCNRKADSEMEIATSTCDKA